MLRIRAIVSYLVVTVTLLFPVAAFPDHPHSKYNKKAAPWIGIALSGGGLRAAAFSHGVMLELRKLCLIRPQDQSTVLIDQDNVEDISQDYTLHYLEDTEYSDDDHPSPCGRGGGASLLDNVHFLSGVSGGAITAAYYKTHPDQLMEFSQKLRATQLQWDLLKKGKKTTPFWRPPLMLLASMLDTAFHTLKLPIPGVPQIELAPVATMYSYDGLFDSEQLAKVYRDRFLNKTSFGDLERLAKNNPTLANAVLNNGAGVEKGIGQANLLINATDIANGRILTFDKDTFACLGNVDDFRKIELSVAVAASSTLPGVFSPVQLNSYLTKAEPTRIPTSCPLILGDQVRSPVLVDGGVSDNLGVTGLLKAIFERKNKNGFPENDQSIAVGQALAIPLDKPSKSLLSSTAPTRLETLQSENPKSQKAFLLIVNAGVTADSSLPNLAGHLDSSFDVLIRDRTDLSRVIAQRMLSSFGFGVVELNMRDLVKSNRVVTRIVRLALANQRTPTLTNGSVRQIAQTFDFTEMERKVLDDLNRVSLIPTEKEIDTLIMAGRAVVAEMSGSIKEEYDKLLGKEYSASCDNIVNSERHYCWHPAFETPHLTANKVGVLLEVLTRTSEDFSRKVSENRSHQLALIRSNLLDLYLDESRAIDLMETGSIRGDRMLACRFNQDELLLKVLRMNRTKAGEKVWPCSDEEKRALPEGEQKVVETAQIALIDTAPAWLKDSPDLPKKDPNPLNAYISSLLDPDMPSAQLEKDNPDFDTWVNSVIEHLLKNENEPRASPMYYYLLARQLILQKRFNEGFHYLYEGLHKFPDNFNLSYLLGYYSIYLNRDFQGGLGHLWSAIEKTSSKLLQINLLPSQMPNQLSETEKAILRTRFARAQERYKLLHAKYTALSPIPLPGRSEYISDEEIDSWLNQNFPDGHGGNDFAALQEFAQRPKSISTERLSGAVCRIKQTLKRISPRAEAKAAITEFLKSYDTYMNNMTEDCPTQSSSNSEVRPVAESAFHSKDFPCGDVHTKEHTLGAKGTDDNNRRFLSACMNFGKVRYSIRELLASKTALHNARAQARRLYESAYEKHVQATYLWERADVYGLTVLIDAAQKECPQRSEDIRTALRLLHVARASVDDDKRLTEADPNFAKGIKKRIARLVDMSKDLACSKGVE